MVDRVTARRSAPFGACGDAEDVAGIIPGKSIAHKRERRRWRQDEETRDGIGNDRVLQQLVLPGSEMRL